MNGKTPSLDQVERWMQSVLMHPGGVTEGIASPVAREHLEISPDELENVIARSRALSSVERLEIYVDAYHERLMECLREEFPATRHAVGNDLFDALAFGYLESFPSRSYTLGRLGADLPRYLCDTRLHAADQPPGAGSTWAEFVIDLARFERLLREVFDAAGTEGHVPFDPNSLLSIQRDDWPRLRITLAPDLRLAEFQHAIDVYWQQFQAGQKPAMPPPTPRRLAIHRRNYVISTHAVSEFEFALLGALAQGMTLLGAITEATTIADQDLHDLFARWANLGFFIGVAI